MNCLDPTQLSGAIIVHGDTAATLEGYRNEYCIGIFGITVDPDSIRRRFERPNEAGLCPMNCRFIEKGELEIQPLPLYGKIDSRGRFVTDTWNRIDHDLCKECGWGFSPDRIDVQLEPELRRELDELKGKVNVASGASECTISRGASLAIRIGGAGERYCNNICYTSAAAEIIKTKASCVYGTCQTCGKDTRAGEGVAVPKNGKIILFCGDCSRASRARAYLERISKCAFCGTALKSQKGKPPGKFFLLGALSLFLVGSAIYGFYHFKVTLPKQADAAFGLLAHTLVKFWEGSSPHQYPDTLVASSLQSVPDLTVSERKESIWYTISFRHKGKPVDCLYFGGKHEVLDLILISEHPLKKDCIVTIDKSGNLKQQQRSEVSRILAGNPLELAKSLLRSSKRIADESGSDPVVTLDGLVPEIRQFEWEGEPRYKVSNLSGCSWEIIFFVDVFAASKEEILNANNGSVTHWKPKSEGILVPNANQMMFLLFPSDVSGAGVFPILTVFPRGDVLIVSGEDAAPLLKYGRRRLHYLREKRRKSLEIRRKEQQAEMEQLRLEKWKLFEKHITGLAAKLTKWADGHGGSFPSTIEEFEELGFVDALNEVSEDFENLHDLSSTFQNANLVGYFSIARSQSEEPTRILAGWALDDGTGDTMHIILKTNGELKRYVNPEEFLMAMRGEDRAIQKDLAGEQRRVTQMLLKIKGEDSRRLSELKPQVAEALLGLEIEEMIDLAKPVVESLQSDEMKTTGTRLLADMNSLVKVRNTLVEAIRRSPQSHRFRLGSGLLPGEVKSADKSGFIVRLGNAGEAEYKWKAVHPENIRQMLEKATKETFPAGDTRNRALQLIRALVPNEQN